MILDRSEGSTHLALKRVDLTDPQHAIFLQHVTMQLHGVLPYDVEVRTQCIMCPGKVKVMEARSSLRVACNSKKRSYSRRKSDLGMFDLGCSSLSGNPMIVCSVDGLSFVENTQCFGTLMRAINSTSSLRRRTSESKDKRGTKSSCKTKEQQNFLDSAAMPLVKTQPGGLKQRQYKLGNCRRSITPKTAATPAPNE